MQAVGGSVLPSAPDPGSSGSPGHWTHAVAYLAARFYLALLLMLALCGTAPLLVGWHVVTIRSGSMEPRISAGDLVVYAPIARDRIERGHVVVARDPARPGTLLTHRVAWVRNNDTLTTRGDANAANDSTPMPLDHVLGVGRLRVPFVGLPLVWWHSHRYVLSLGFLVVTGAAWTLVARRAPTLLKPPLNSSAR